MSTTEDTSAIDEKKTEEFGTSTTSPDFKGFIKNYLSSIIFTIGISIFIIGGLGLYTTKVAQSNILPDDIELAPYTIFDRVVQPDFKVDMNVMRPSFFSDNKETLSQKALFNSQEYLDSFNKSFLCSLKKSADPNAGLFSNAPLYFSFVYDNLVAKNFLAINTIFFYLSYLPESAIMFLYGIFGIFLWIGLYFFNLCISIFYHIINIPQLFRDVQESQQYGILSGLLGEEQKPDTNLKWEATEEINFLRFVKLLLFFFLWIPIGTLSAFVMPAFFTLYGLIAPLFATYEIKTSTKQPKSFNVMDFIRDTFAYKKFFFFILATLSLFSNGITYLGNNAIVGIIVAVMFAYFMGLYTNEMQESGTEGFTFKIKQNITQAKVADPNSDDLVKICQQIPIDDKKLESKISGKTPRNLTKPNEVGGAADYYDDNVEIVTKPSTPSLSEIDVESSSQPSPKLVNIQNRIYDLEKQLNDSYKNVTSEKDSWGHTILENQIQPEIDKLRVELLNLNQQQNQSGGKKKNIKPYKLVNTKYNIRWT